jgi:threonine dehydrogenase-like Zn-dependent dehydrogenase
LGWTCAGAFAELMVAPADMLAQVPHTISDSEAAAIQPLSDAAAAVDVAAIHEGDTVVIIGQGVMGLMCLQVARCLKAGTIIVVDVNRNALELAATMQADFLVDSSRTDPVGEVLRITGGVGAEVVFDAAGGNPKAGLGGINTFYQATRMARLGGRIVPIALFSESIPLDTSQMRDRGLRVIFPPPSSHEILLRSIDWVAAGTVRLGPLITHVLKGLNQVPQAFAITAEKRQYRATGPAQVIIHSGPSQDAQ